MKKKAPKKKTDTAGTATEIRAWTRVTIYANPDGSVGLQIEAEPAFPPPSQGKDLTLIQAVGVKLMMEAKKFLQGMNEGESEE